MNDLDYRRARFVYEACRLAAIAAKAPVIPRPFEERGKEFAEELIKMVNRQSKMQSEAVLVEAVRIHDEWWESYKKMGWVYGPVYSEKEKTHPDMVPFEDLDPREQDKDYVFIEMCKIAERYIY